MASTNDPGADAQLPDVSDKTIPTVGKHFRLQFEKAQDSWVLLYPEGMIKLNQSAGEILNRCDGQRDVAAIVSNLEQSFNETGLNDDVVAFMQIAAKQNWITLS